MATTAPDNTTTWPDFAESLYERLTGRGTTIKYSLEDFVVEVPKATGVDAPSATWKFNGTVAISTVESGS